MYDDRLTLHGIPAGSAVLIQFAWSPATAIERVSQVNTISICTLLTQLYRTHRESDTLYTHCEPVLAVI